MHLACRLWVANVVLCKFVVHNHHIDNNRFCFKSFLFTVGCIACSYCIPLSSASSIDGKCSCLGGITVSSPHAGDIVYTGVTFTLLFYMPPAQTTMNLYLFYDGQMTAYGAIGYNLAATGAYSINLPQGIPSGKAFLYIQGYQNNTYQGRSDTFTLLPGGMFVFVIRYSCC